MTPVIDPPLLAVEPSYRHVLRARLALTWLPLAIAAVVADRVLLGDTPYYGAASIAAVTLGVAVVLIIPQRKFRRLSYRLTDRMLQSVHGWMFRVDTIVPFVRVQHLDVTRGPLDKMFGTASLVVHTAGTHNSMVTVHGLAPDRAAEIRDVIREHVRSDFE
jgi:membrane protein YdbS with pleckstrin-like domain